jgi:RNA polymerase sigma factor (sigma-70 family)
MRVSQFAIRNSLFSNIPRNLVPRKPRRIRILRTNTPSNSDDLVLECRPLQVKSGMAVLKFGKGAIKPHSELVARCLSGDEGAWAELIERYQRLIYSVAYTLSESSEDAADVFQQVCLELYQRLHQLRDVETLPAWLITVTRRQAGAVLKSRKGFVAISEEHPHVDERIGAIENEYLVERALLDLPERCRTMIDLLYRHPSQPSYAEIAQRLGIPVSSIGPTRARCLEKLRKLLS